jgi:hypothetical protein
MNMVLLEESCIFNFVEGMFHVDTVLAPGRRKDFNHSWEIAQVLNVARSVANGGPLSSKQHPFVDFSSRER